MERLMIQGVRGCWGGGQLSHAVLKGQLSKVWGDADLTLGLRIGKIVVKEET